MEPERKTRLLKKSVGLIHGSGTTHFLDKKIYQALVLNAYGNLIQDSVHFISLSDLKEIIGFNSNNIEAIKDALRRLRKISVEFDILKQLTKYAEKERINLGLGQWHTMTLLSEASIDKGIISYEFSTTMRRLLYEPDLYEIVDVDIAKEFSSGYSYGLYEIGFRASKISKTGWLDIQSFRKIMDVPENAYKRFSDLRKRVIHVAEDEIKVLYEKNILPFWISIKEKKIGKKVHFINVVVKDKREDIFKSKRIDHQSLSPEQEDMVKLLNKQYKLHIKQAILIIEKNSLDYVKGILKKIDIHRGNNGFNDSKLGGFTYSALTKKINLFDMEDENRLKRKEETSKIGEYNDYARKFCYEYFDSLSKVELDQLIMEVTGSNKCPISYSITLNSQGLKGEGRELLAHLMCKEPFSERLYDLGLKKAVNN